MKDTDHQLVYHGFVSDNDIKAQYKYTTLLDRQIYADESIYTDIPAILDFASAYKIDMIYAGWGYLSENADFVRAIEAKGITFMGPTADTMERVGNKIRSYELAEQLGVPVLPWSTGSDATGIPYPVMLKASNSGGGKGLRIVRRAEEFAPAWWEIKTEVPNTEIFVVKYIEQGLHFEIQVIGDGQSVCHLYGRDCTTQRRNQKLVEECPITAADPEILDRIQTYAVKMMDAVHYLGLATVEFIYDKSDDGVYFLEVNPRVQVEHIITEQWFSINLIRMLYQISCGATLAEIGLPLPRPTGHVISVRINAENPYDNFCPNIGRIEDISMTYSRSTWGYFSSEIGGEITPMADSQIGHLMAWGPTRESAIRTMVHLIERAKITGIYTTAGFLKNYIKSPEFATGAHYTRYLQTISPYTMVNQHLSDELVVRLSMIYLAWEANKKKAPLCRESLARGHNFLLSEYNQMTEDIVLYKDYRYTYRHLALLHENEIVIYIEPWYYRVHYSVVQNTMILHGEQGVMYKIQHGYKDGQSIDIIINHQKYGIKYRDYDEILRSPVGGKIIECQPEKYIDAGEVYVRIECMKMLLPFRTERGGRISYFKRKGDLVNIGEPLARIEGGAPAGPKLLGTLSPWALFPGTAADIDQVRALNAKWAVRSPVELAPATEPINFPAYFSTNYALLFPAAERTGLTAWHIDAPAGFILMVHDITWKNGTFSKKEIDRFYEGLNHARQTKCPFVYIASNSGAEISINEELKFVVKQADDYLWLTPEDYPRYANHVCAEYLPDCHRYKINIIKNTGIETLNGCAQLVREMALARKEIPTFTLVLERNVGVGAYLAKLSERIIQRKDSPLLLTGFQALNKVLHKDLYESNLQLGGPTIMGGNGVTQNVVESTLDGLACVRHLLGFALQPKVSPGQPETLGALTGIIDKDTFYPTFSGYAETVITGRARIGGRAYGVVYNSSEPCERVTPCDPGNLTSSIQKETQSPYILYPDTAYKIAKTIQAVQVESLPLLILADWRGFSGGTRDMYNHVLDFGALIIQELSDFTKPVYIYVPPGGQLRGGAMVVFSKALNPACITFCASKTARINVLEPSGMKELRYRQKDITRYAQEQQVSAHIAEQTAERYTELNDFIPEGASMIDALCEPSELRAIMLQRAAE